MFKNDVIKNTINADVTQLRNQNRGCFPDLTQFDIYVLQENFDLKCVVSFDIETFGYERAR